MNIIFNWKKTLINISECIIAGTTAIQAPIITIFAILFIVNRILNSCCAEITELHSSILLIAWQNRDNEYCFNEKYILITINKEQKKNNLPAIKNSKLKKILLDLERLGCINEKPGGKWFIRELVIIKERII